MSAQNGTGPEMVPIGVVRQFIAQRDKALYELAVAQDANQQLAARVRELEQRTTETVGD